MATVHRRRRDMAAGQLPTRRDFHGNAEGTGFIQALDILDRPLRSLAGEDLPLLQIYRCTVIGVMFAAFGAIITGIIL